MVSRTLSHSSRIKCRTDSSFNSFNSASCTPVMQSQPSSFRHFFQATIHNLIFVQELTPEFYDVLMERWSIALQTAFTNSTNVQNEVKAVIKCKAWHEHVR